MQHTENTKDESLNRALADLEMLQAAYPDEVTIGKNNDSFPLYMTLSLSADSLVELEFARGYPMTSGISISKYRSPHKARMNATLTAIRTAAATSLEDGVEGGFSCCAAAFVAWNDYETPKTSIKEEEIIETQTFLAPKVDWMTGEALVDRKSTFVARACRVFSENQVHEALHELISGNSKLQRATHNMYAYRLSEELPNGVVVKKFDNDDDGEHGAGQCLGRLLEMRGEDGVLVVVSRWYGGIHLGPKRFAHISNVARELLVKCHEKEWKGDG